MGSMRFARAAAAVAFVMLAASPAAAEVFRCKGPNGKLVYSDSPCTSNSTGGVIELRENSLDTRMDREHNERYIERQRQQGTGEQGMNTVPTTGTTQDTQRDSPTCRLAIRNANTQSSSATPAKIDSDRAEAIRECGFNPWPGKTASEIDAENRRSRAIERAARSQPAQITTCDASGCWDTMGNRYNGTGQTLFRTDGRTCTRVGNTLQCM